MNNTEHADENKTFVENYDDLVKNINYLAKNKKFTEAQIIQLFELIDVRVLVENNKLSSQFMENILRSRLEDDFGDFGSKKMNITYNEAKKIQNNMNK